MSRGTQQRINLAGAQRLPGRLYAAAVVTLAIFLLGLMISRTRIDGYLVEAELGSPVASLGAEPASARSTESAKSTESVSDPAVELSAQQVANAVRAAREQVGSDAPEQGSDALTDVYLNQLTDSLTVRRANVAGGSDSIILSFRGGDFRWSLAFVDNLARQLLIGQSAQPQSQRCPWESIRQARWKLRQAQHYERKARFDMEDVLLSDLEQIEDGSVEVAGGATASQAALGTPGSSSAPTPNPAWTEFQEMRAAARRQLDQLLQTATAEHPMVHHLKQRVAELDGKLAETPQFLGSVEQPISASAVTHASGSEPAVEWNSRSVSYAASEEAPAGSGGESPSSGYETLSPRFLQLRNSYEIAIADREAAQNRVAELIAIYHGESQSGGGVAASVVRPAALVRCLGGELAGWATLVSGVVALLCGALVYRGITSLDGLRHIDSLGQLSATVPLPLIGRISIDPVSPRMQRRAAWGTALRWSARVCEVLLFVLVALFLVSSLRDSPAGAELMDNPLRAIVDRVGSFIGI